MRTRGVRAQQTPPDPFRPSRLVTLLECCRESGNSHLEGMVSGRGACAICSRERVRKKRRQGWYTCHRWCSTNNSGRNGLEMASISVCQSGPGRPPSESWFSSHWLPLVGSQPSRVFEKLVAVIEDAHPRRRTLGIRCGVGRNFPGQTEALYQPGEYKAFPRSSPGIRCRQKQWNTLKHRTITC